MDKGQEEKPFDMVSIVLLIMVALLDDATTIVADFAFAIPVIGQIAFGLDKFFEFVAWAVINFWFIMKLRTFGKPGIVNAVGGLVEEGGLPATTITTAVAIWIANHPKTAEAAMLSAATTTTGIKAIGAEGPAAGKAGAGEATAATAAAGAEALEAGPAAEAEIAEKAAAKEIPPEALGEEKEPLEKLMELTQKVPEGEEKPEGQQAQGSQVEIDDDQNEINLKNV